MTSGNFVVKLLGEINVDRESRQRKKLPDLTELADSIKRLGLIHPIVIDRENNLVAGECRLEAVRSLGYTSITCQYMDELDPLVAHAIELEENVKRAQLPWQDEVKAVLEYHELRSFQEPDWSQEKTAEALGLSKQTVNEKIMVAREQRQGNDMVKEAPRYSTALGIVRRAEARKDEAALAAIPLRSATSSTPPLDEEEAVPDSILCADFNRWASTYDGPRFNFLHCDFPYGIGADKFNQGAASLHGGYSDTEEDYWTLLTTLVTNLDRLCTESCHIMFWYSMHYHQETIDFFHKHTDFRIDPFPLVWTKSDNIGILPDAQRGPRRIYETCLFGSRGDRKIVRSVSNSISLPSQRDDHMSIKPEAMLVHFFRMFVDSNTRMLDPTAGSGGALRAAEGLSARYVLGLERNPDFAKRANDVLRKSRRERSVTEAAQ